MLAKELIAEYRLEDSNCLQINILSKLADLSEDERDYEAAI